ncbi:MAG TPA: ATP-binding protein [Stellaceae bacterium]|jgi:signal transduction histidine kinase|nr:ATP-binding protein [Stellaceae bacterium]
MTRFHIGKGISQKILMGFVAMALMLVALGVYGYHVLEAAGTIVADMYDRPLMTVNYGRSAGQIFTEMEKEMYRRQFASPTARDAIDQAMPRLARNFAEDLSIARQRALSDGERGIIDDIQRDVALWNERWEAAPAKPDILELETLSAKIAESFDRLVELTTDNSFVERRKGLSAIAQFKYSTIGVMAWGLLVAGLITFFLARRIVRPLSIAATVADRIASGQLDTIIPRGFDDETGVLLHSMSVMRDGIKTMMAREQNQRRSAQTRLVDALESSHEGMVLVDSGGSILIANSQIGEFFPALAPLCREGVEFSAFARSIRGQLLHPEEAPDHDALLANGGEFQLADHRWIRVSRSRTRDRGEFFFFTDFTDIKEREQRYREAQLAAEAASRAKSSFLANMGHELRTPLNAIIGFSEILQRGLSGGADSNHGAYIADILQSGRHLLSIINGVLDLAKSQAGTLTVNFEPIDMGDVLGDCAEMMRDQCVRGGLTLELAKPAGLLPVSGEPSKLRQVVLNLLSNAVKFTEPGGSIALAARDQGDTIAIEVRDTGIGMSADDVTVALTPFGQVDNRLARRYEGTGLGLPLAMGLVELHGGTMAIDSAPGRGTTVRIVLPSLARAEREAPLETVAA